MPRVTSADCLLYYITDRMGFPGDESMRWRCILDKVAEATACGVDYIQLREKDLSGRELGSLAREAMSIMHELKTENHDLKTALLINSRTDVALASEADGVHLRSDVVSPQDIRIAWKRVAGECSAGTPARDLAPSDPLIGVSCHSPEEVARASANRASLVVFAPVFEKRGTAPSGLQMLREACRVKIPVLALGGVTTQNAASCLQAGAAGIAGIRLFQENDISAVVRALRRSPRGSDQN